MLARKLLTRLIHTILALHTLLYLLDSFPLHLTLLGLFSHLIYLQNLRSFPLVRLADPFFLLSILLVFANHYIAFRHFQKPPHHQNYYNQGAGYGSGGGNWAAPYGYDPALVSDPPTFQMIAAYFGICVWAVPFSLFVALSAGDNVLPSTEVMQQHGGGMGVDGGNVSGSADREGRKREGLAKSVIDRVRGWMGEMGG